MTTPAPSPPPLELLKEENERRKSLAAEARRNDYTVTVHVGEDMWTWCLGDVTARHAGLLRAQTGSEKLDPVGYLLLLLDGLRDTGLAPLDVVAQVVYLARLQAGDDVTYAHVADSITLGADARIIFPEADTPVPAAGEVVVLDPPGSGGRS